MKAEKISRFFIGTMLALFVLLIVSAMLLGIFCGDGSRGRMASFAAALALAAAYGLAMRWLQAEKFRLRALNAAKTGAVLAALCLAFNLAWVLFFQLEPSVDFLTFWNTARDLASGGELSQGIYVALFPHILGYSAFLSIFIRLFGPLPMLAPILNVLLTTASGLIIYLLCLRWRGVRTAFLAMLLWTLCPSKLLYNAMVLSEPLYTFLVLLFMLVLSGLEGRFGREKCGQWQLGLLALGAAGALALMNAARPIAAVPIIAFFIWLLLLRGRALGDTRLWRRWLAFAGALLALYFLIGRCWSAWAEQTLGEKLPDIPGYSICVGFNTRTGGSYADEDMNLLFECRKELGSAAAAQDRMLAYARDRVESGEIDFPALFANKLRVFLGNDEGGAYYSLAGLNPRQYTLLAMASNVFYYFLLLLALGGALNIWRDSNKRALLLAPMYVLGLTLAQMLVEVAGRYHYSIIPMLVICAAFSCGERRKNAA